MSVGLGVVGGGGWGGVRAGEVFEKVGESRVVHVEVCYRGVFALVLISLLWLECGVGSY